MTDNAPGGVNASERTVLAYLKHPKGGNLSEKDALTLMGKHLDLLEKGIKFASFANYVGDQMLRAEGLPEGEGD